MTTPNVETADFGPLLIDFDSRVLRPRSWTTAQSYWSAELLSDAPTGPVLELCAGAGQLGLLAIATAERDLVLVDADPVACDYARINARRAGLSARVSIRCAPFDRALDASERFAFVVADPPWVPSHDVGRFPEDPPFAIDGGPDGLDAAWTCVRLMSTHLVDGGAAVLQLGSLAQKARLREELDANSELGLKVMGTRRYDRGVLVHLLRV